MPSKRRPALYPNFSFQRTFPIRYVNKIVVENRRVLKICMATLLSPKNLKINPYTKGNKGKSVHALIPFPHLVRK